MLRENIAFIINPKSGKRKNTNLESVIQKHIDHTRYQVSFHYTEYRGHGRLLANKLIEEGYKKIVAVGGDGTVNEIASSLAGIKATLGIIPRGSGNGLARHLGISTRIQKSIRILNAGKTKCIDAGKIQEKWFFCTCGVGFDAKVSHKFSKSRKRGLKTYVKTVTRELKKYKPKKYRFIIDGIKYKRKAFLITVANAAQYGNNSFIAPGAKIDDGLFHITLIKPFPLYKSVFISLRLMNRTIENSKYFEMLQGKEIQFKKLKKKYYFHFDGEPHKFRRKKITITMHPQQLEVIVP